MREAIYGRNPVYECLRAGRRDVFKLILARNVQESGQVAQAVTMARDRGVPVLRADRGQLDKVSGGANHQGVVAEVGGYRYASVDEITAVAERKGEPAWVLLLDCLQDPQNLATLLRTAEVVGVHGVILLERRAVGVTPAVVHASSGASEHLMITQVTNLVRTIGELKECNLWIAGLEDAPDAQLLWEADLDGALGLVVGSEGRGMRRLVRENCDFLVRLPMRGQINSLNAAVAGSVALYEVGRRRGMGFAR